MESRTRNTLLGAAAGCAGTLGLLLLLGFRHGPQVRLPARKTIASPASVKPLDGVYVVLDPGHGGADPGTTSGPLSEAALTYRTADELGACLEAQGASVVYTVRSRRLDPCLAALEPPLERPTDAVMAVTGNPLRERHSPRPLWQRAGTARAVWATRRRWDPEAARDVFFLSLHFDQFPDDGIHGGVVCVDRRSRAVPALARALAAQMTQGSLGRNGDFHGIRDLAGRDLGVLDPDYNPVPQKALLEIATLSNPEDAQNAGDAVWRGEMVQRIAEAITQTHQNTARP